MESHQLSPSKQTNRQGKNHKFKIQRNQNPGNSRKQNPTTQDQRITRTSLGRQDTAAIVHAELGLGLIVPLELCFGAAASRGVLPAAAPDGEKWKKRSVFGPRAWKKPFTLFFMNLHRRAVVWRDPSEAHLRGKTRAALILAPIGGFASWGAGEFPGRQGAETQSGGNLALAYVDWI